MQPPWISLPIRITVFTEKFIDLPSIRTAIFKTSFVLDPILRCEHSTIGNSYQLAIIPIAVKGDAEVVVMISGHMMYGLDDAAAKQEMERLREAIDSLMRRLFNFFQSTLGMNTELQFQYSVC
jgi:hypothetical protein